MSEREAEYLKEWLNTKPVHFSPRKAQEAVDAMELEVLQDRITNLRHTLLTIIAVAHGSSCEDRFSAEGHAACYELAKVELAQDFTGAKARARAALE